MDRKQTNPDLHVSSEGDSNTLRLPKRQRCEPLWPLHLQRAFVEAIYKIGLKTSSPNSILENMALKSYEIVGDRVKRGHDITGEHVKSHLQKHRKKPDKVIKEFMISYDTALSKLDSIGMWNEMNEPENILDSAITALGCKPNLLLGAEPAAFLSLCSNPFLHPNGHELNTFEAERDLYHSTAQVTIEEFHAENPLEILERCTSLSMPLLTEDEKKTSLGKTLAFVMGMFDSFKRHIADYRRHQQSSRMIINSNKLKSSSLMKQDSQDRSGDPSITPIDMDDMRKNYFVYEPSESSLTRLTQISQQEFSLNNEVHQLPGQYPSTKGTAKVVKKRRVITSIPRIDKCQGNVDTTYLLTHDLKNDHRHTHEPPIDSDDRSIQRLVNNWNAHLDHPYSSILSNNSTDSMKTDFDASLFRPSL